MQKARSSYSPRVAEILKEVELKGKKCSNITLIELEKDIAGYVTMADRGCFEVIEVNKHELSF